MCCESSLCHDIAIVTYFSMTWLATYVTQKIYAMASLSDAMHSIASHVSAGYRYSYNYI